MAAIFSDSQRYVFMHDRKAGSHDDKYPRKSSGTDETYLEPAGEVEVHPQDAPPKPSETKRIHPRRPMPPVPEAPVEDKEED